jgi:hypothetical protein
MVIIVQTHVPLDFLENSAVNIVNASQMKIVIQNTDVKVLFFFQTFVLNAELLFNVLNGKKDQRAQRKSLTTLFTHSTQIVQNQNGGLPNSPQVGKKYLG